jgi:hypothetical protein
MPQRLYHFVSFCNIAMLVAVPAAPPWQKWQELAQHLTDYCRFIISHVLAQPAGARPLRRSFPSRRALRRLRAVAPPGQ